MVHVAGSIAVVLVDESIVKGDLRVTHLIVVVGIVKTEAIRECQTLYRHKVELEFAVYLLTVGGVFVVVKCPIRVGDTIRSEVGFRSVERAAEILHVNDRDVTGHFKHTVNH